MNLKDKLPSLPFGDKPLKEAPLRLYNEVKFTDNIKKDVSVIDSNLTISIEPTATINTYVVNSIDDLDNDQLKGGCLDESKLSEILKKKVVVMHAINGRLSGKAGLPIKDILNFELGLNKSVSLKWFKPYDNNLTAGEVIIDDLKDYKSLLTHSGNADFWDLMNINEAYSYSYYGELDFNVNVNLAKNLGMAFNPVFALTNSGVKIPLELDPSLTIGFNIAKSDVFECLICKESDNEFSLKLLKKKVNVKGVSLSGALSVSLLKADQDKIKSIIDKYFEEYLGDTITKIDNQIEKYDSYVEDEFMLQLIEKIDFVGDNIDKLKKHYEGYKKKVIDAKEEVIELTSKSVELGLGYEYKKVVKKGVFLDAVITKGVLKEHLKQILTLDIRELLQIARTNTVDVKVNEYFNEKSITFERSFSIGLSIGNWALKSSKEEIYSIDEKYFDLEDKRTISIAYKFSKEKTRGKELMAYEVSMSSESREADIDISYDELDYALTLTASKYDNEVKGKKGRRDMQDMNLLLTTCVAWGAVDSEQIQSYSADIWDKVYKDKDVKYECKLSIPISAFESVLNALSKHISFDTIADAMSIAILPHRKHKESSIAENRLKFYSKIILNRFKGVSVDKTLEDDYYSDNFKKWAWREMDSSREENDEFIGGENIMKGLDVAKKLVSAVNVLDNYIQTDKPLESHQNRKNKTALILFFNALKEISKDKHGFNQRWFGQLIIAAVLEKNPELMNSLVRNMTINYKENGKEKVMIIGN